MTIGKIALMGLATMLMATMPANAKYKRITLNTKCQICEECNKGMGGVTKSCLNKMASSCRGKGLYFVGINDANKFYTGKNGTRSANITYSCADIDTAKKIGEIYGK